MIACKHQQRRQHQRPAAQCQQGGAEQSGQHHQHPADGGLVRRRGKGVGKAGVLCHRERCHGQAREGPFQHKGQCPAQAHPGREVHAGAKGKVGRKITAQPDHRKGTAVGVFEDLQLLFPVAIAGKGITGVGIAIQVDAARDPDRDQAEPRRFCGHRQGQSAAQAPQPANDHPDERESTHGIPHVFLVPRELRHRQGRKHGKGHCNGLQSNHFSTPL